MRLVLHPHVLLLGCPRAGKQEVDKLEDAKRARAEGHGHKMARHFRNLCML
jgi:hypothetical protein